MKFSFDIKKRYMFVTIGILILLAGILTVYAFTGPWEYGNPPVMGHGASEIGSGSFLGDFYSFQKKISIGGYSGDIGQLYILSGKDAAADSVLLTNDGSGSFLLKTGIAPESDLLKVTKTGDVEINGAQLYLGKPTIGSSGGNIYFRSDRADQWASITSYYNNLYFQTFDARTPPTAVTRFSISGEGNAALLTPNSVLTVPRLTASEITLGGVARTSWPTPTTPTFSLANCQWGDDVESQTCIDKFGPNFIQVGYDTTSGGGKGKRYCCKLSLS